MSALRKRGEGNGRTSRQQPSSGQRGVGATPKRLSTTRLRTDSGKHELGRRRPGSPPVVSATRFPKHSLGDCKGLKEDHLDSTEEGKGKRKGKGLCSTGPKQVSVTSHACCNGSLTKNEFVGPESTSSKKAVRHDAQKARTDDGGRRMESRRGGLLFLSCLARVGGGYAAGGTAGLCDPNNFCVSSLGPKRLVTKAKSSCAAASSTPSKALAREQSRRRR